MIAESPPYNLTKAGEIRYFYLETVTDKDALLINTIKGIYSVEKYRGSYKEACLKRLKSDGFFLIDAVEYPIDQFGKDMKKRNRHIRINFNNLIEKIEKLEEKSHIDKETKIILIKNNIFEELGEDLKEKGFNVLNEKSLPFPYWGRNANNFKKELHDLLSNDGFFEF